VPGPTHAPDHTECRKSELAAHVVRCHQLVLDAREDESRDDPEEEPAEKPKERVEQLARSIRRNARIELHVRELRCGTIRLDLDDLVLQHVDLSGDETGPLRWLRSVRLPGCVQLFHEACDDSVGVLLPAEVDIIAEDLRHPPCRRGRELLRGRRRLDVDDRARRGRPGADGHTVSERGAIPERALRKVLVEVLHVSLGHAGVCIRVGVPGRHDQCSRTGVGRSLRPGVSG
jgi:hypothetical protein